MVFVLLVLPRATIFERIQTERLRHVLSTGKASVLPVFTQLLLMTSKRSLYRSTVLCTVLASFSLHCINKSIPSIFGMFNDIILLDNAYLSVQ